MYAAELFRDQSFVIFFCYGISEKFSVKMKCSEICKVDYIFIIRTKRCARKKHARKRESEHLLKKRKQNGGNINAAMLDRLVKFGDFF